MPLAPDVPVFDTLGMNIRMSCTGAASARATRPTSVVAATATSARAQTAVRTTRHGWRTLTRVTSAWVVVLGESTRRAVTQAAFANCEVRSSARSFITAAVWIWLTRDSETSITRLISLSVSSSW